MKVKFPQLLENSRYMQYFAAITATLSVASGAIYSTWSSPSLPKLQSPNSPIGIQITPAQGSWVASSYLLGAIPGGLISRFIVEKLGRKKSLLFATIPLFLPWMVIIFAKSVLVLIIARAVAGIGGAIAGTAVPMYNGEIAEKDIRGKLGATFNILKLSGSLYVLSVGPFVSYFALNISCSAFPLIFVSLFCFMPESPYYLIKTGKQNAARNNLVRLSTKNCKNETISRRLHKIGQTVEFDMKNKSTLWEFLSKREYRKSLILLFGLKTIQQLSGMTALDAYMQTVIQASKSSITPEVSSIICGFVQILAALIAAVLVDKMGRKPLMIISSLGCALALTAEGTYFYLQDVAKVNIDNLSWLPTTSLTLFLIMNPMGLFTLPYILMGELFATNIKGIAVSVSTVYGSILGFLAIKFFEPISTAWGMHTMFWIFAGICFLGAPFSLFVLPETKGKTLAEIQEKLRS